MKIPLIHPHTLVWALQSHLIHGRLPRNPWNEQETCIISPRFQASLLPQWWRSRWISHGCETEARQVDKNVDFWTVGKSLFKVVVVEIFQNHDAFVILMCVNCVWWTTKHKWNQWQLHQWLTCGEQMHVYWWILSNSAQMLHWLTSNNNWWC